MSSTRTGTRPNRDTAPTTAPVTGVTDRRAVDAAAYTHREGRLGTPVATMPLDGFVINLYGDGTTGVVLRHVRVAKQDVIGYVELDAADTIRRVTAVDAGTSRTLDLAHRQLAGHAALRVTLTARRHLRGIVAAHARPRRVAPRL